MKHIDFSKPLKLISLPIKRKYVPPHKKIIYERKITWTKNPRDLPTKERLRK